ncbi:hypothetical protein BGX23_002642 [Mortierella sp. AD031]|nr:hypothetical protein BGX23_002642 [Mortierella sp. AD031]
MDDRDMEEDFDFGALTLGEFPRSSSLPQPSDVLQLSSSLSVATLSDQSSAAAATTTTTSTGSSAPTITATETINQTPDNGPWAQLPSATEVNPYLPGMDARKLDAMAMDPHHVFKSAQTPSPFPFTVPPAQAEDEKSQQEKAKKQQQDVDEKDKIPEWMLADPELKPTTHFSWSTTTTSTTDTTTAKTDDDLLGWGDPNMFDGELFNGQDLSTTVDSNAVFGFSSFPTYGTLPIANAIAEEQHRRNTILATGWDPASSSSSSGESHTRTREGGFARFGNTVRGDGQVAPVFGRRPSLVSGSGYGLDESATTTTTSSGGVFGSSSNDHGFTWDNQDQRRSLMMGSSQQQHPEHQHQHQWQTWRSSGSQTGHDMDQLMDEDLEDDPFSEHQSSEIK